MKQTSANIGRRITQALIDRIVYLDIPRRRAEQEIGIRNGAVEPGSASQPEFTLTQSIRANALILATYDERIARATFPPRGRPAALRACPLAGVYSGRCWRKRGEWTIEN